MLCFSLLSHSEFQAWFIIQHQVRSWVWANVNKSTDTQNTIMYSHRFSTLARVSRQPILTRRSLSTQNHQTLITNIKWLKTDKKMLHVSFQGFISFVTQFYKKKTKLQWQIKPAVLFFTVKEIAMNFTGINRWKLLLVCCLDWIVRKWVLLQ